MNYFCTLKPRSASPRIHWPRIVGAVFLFCISISAQESDSASRLATKTRECLEHLDGKVINSNGDPLPGALVTTLIPPSKSVTDAREYFHLDELCIEATTLSISAASFSPILQNLTLPRLDEVVIQMNDDVLVMEQATAHTQRKSIGTNSSITLAGHELERSLGRSLGEALTAVEGVSLLRSGPTINKPTIHGMQGNRIQILNNGAKVEGQQWGSEHAPEIDPFLAGSLTVIKGAAGVRYGADALGGVILVTPKPLRFIPGMDGEWHAMGTSQGYGGATALRVDFAPKNLLGFAIRGQGTLKKTGDVHTPDYGLQNTGLEEKNGTLMLGYGNERVSLEAYYSRFNTKIGILSASHIGNLTDLNNALNRRKPNEARAFSYQIGRPYQQVVHDLLKFRATWFSSKGSLELQYTGQNNDRSEYDKHKPLNDSLAAKNKPELRFMIESQALDFIWDIPRLKAFTTQVGLSGQNQGNRSLGRQFIPNFENWNGGMFGLAKWKHGELEFESGARLDYRDMNVYRNIRGTVVKQNFAYNGQSGILGAAWHYGPHFEIRAQSSTAWRPPGVNELYSNGLHHGAASVEIGDTTLQAENAWNSSISLTTQAGIIKNAEAQFFINRIDDFIGLVPEQPPTLTIRGAFPTFHYRQTDALIRGMDLRSTFALRRWLEYDFRGALLWAQDDRSGDALLNMPSHRVENALTMSKDRFYAARDLFLTLRVQTVIKQTDASMDDYAPPPDGYSLFNLESGFSVPLSPCREKQNREKPQSCRTVNLEGQIRNMFDLSYRDYTNRFRYYVDEPGREYSLRIKLAF